MPDIPLLLLLAISTGVFLGGLSKGTIGLGFPMVAVPAVALLVDPKAAVVIVSVPNLLINLVYIVQQGKPPPGWTVILPLLVAGVVGCTIGILALRQIDIQLLNVLLGGMVLLYVVLAIWQINLVIPHRWRAGAGVLAGGVSGFLQGTTGAAGTPLTIYLRGIEVDKVSFVYLITIAFTLLNAVQLVGYQAAGLYREETMGLALALTIPAVIGLFAGIHIQRRVNQVIFNRIVLVALVILGANLLLRGLGVL